MKTIDQVCTPDQGKRLQQLGVKQFISMFCFAVFMPDPVGEHYVETITYRDSHPEMPGEHICDVFTSAELGWLIIVDDDTHFIDTAYNEHLGCWCVNLNKRDSRTVTGFKHSYQTEGDTEAAARAEMLIYLLEQKIINPANCDLSVA